MKLVLNICNEPRFLGLLLTCLITFGILIGDRTQMSPVAQSRKTESAHSKTTANKISSDLRERIGKAQIDERVSVIVQTNETEGDSLDALFRATVRRKNAGSSNSPREPSKFRLARWKISRQPNRFDMFHQIKKPNGSVILIRQPARRQ